MRKHSPVYLFVPFSLFSTASTICPDFRNFPLYDFLSLRPSLSLFLAL